MITLFQTVSTIELCTYYKPKNLNVKELLQQYPFSPKQNLRSPQKVVRNLQFLVHNLLSRMCTGKFRDSVDAFIPLNARVMEGFVRDYNVYIDWLCSVGVFECDDLCIPAEKSRGYRLTEKYRYSEWVSFTVHDPLHSRKFREADYTDQTVVEKLNDWFQYLEIDENRALDRLEVFRAEKIQEILNEGIDQVDTVNQDQARISAEKQTQHFYNTNKLAIERFSKKTIPPIKRTTSDFRVHSALTNLKSEFIQDLTFKKDDVESTLVSVDIKSCQPMLLGVICSYDFLKYNQWVYGLSVIDSFDEVYSLFSLDSSFSPNMFSILADSACFRKEVKRYNKIVQNKDIYKYLMKKINEKYPNQVESRNQMKRKFLECIFSPNMMMSPERKVFIQLFPKMWSLIKYINKGYIYTNKMKKLNAKKYKNAIKCPLSRILQRFESFLVIDQVCVAIQFEYPQLPIYTKHDAILTCHEHLDTVQEAMHEVFINWIPIRNDII